MSDLLPLSQSVAFERTLIQQGQRAVRHAGLLVLPRRVAGLRLALASRVHLADPDGLDPLAGHRLIISPDHPADWLRGSGAVPLVTAATVAELYLDKGPDALRAGLHGKWRNRLTHAEAQTLEVGQGNMPPDPDHWLFREDARQQAARGYRGWPADLTLAFARANPGNAILFTANDKGTPVAAMLFLAHGRVATYHVGHTTTKGRKMSAHTRLLWHAARRFSDEGYRRLDLGLIDTETAPGLARFKLGSGAQARRLGGTWLWLPGLAACLGRAA